MHDANHSQTKSLTMAGVFMIGSPRTADMIPDFLLMNAHVRAGMTRWRKPDTQSTAKTSHTTPVIRVKKGLMRSIDV